jgi:hypothetical protein
MFLLLYIEVSALLYWLFSAGLKLAWISNEQHGGGALEWQTQRAC